MGLRGAGYYMTALVVETVWGAGEITMGRGDLNPEATEGQGGLRRAAEVAIRQARGKREVQEAIACRLDRLWRVGRLDAGSRRLGCMHEVYEVWGVSKRGDSVLLWGPKRPL